VVDGDDPAPDVVGEGASRALPLEVLLGDAALGGGDLERDEGLLFEPLVREGWARPAGQAIVDGQALLVQQLDLAI